MRRSAFGMAIVLWRSMKRSVSVTEMPGHITSGALAVGSRRFRGLIVKWMRGAAHQELTLLSRILMAYRANTCTTYMEGETRLGMNPSPWKPAGTSLQRVQPGVLHQNWSTRIARHWFILLLVIALSVGVLPLLQVKKARTTRRQDSYVLLPVFTRQDELDYYEAPSSQYLTTVNTTTRRLLLEPFDKVPIPRVPYPKWRPDRNTWDVKRLRESLLFVRMKVVNVSYHLELDFRGQLTWINCKWIPEDKRGKWTKFVEKFKPHQLVGPHGLHVPANYAWCDDRFCNELHDKEKKRGRCKEGVCHFNNPYGNSETIEGFLALGNATLCADTVPVEDNQRLLPMIYGCVYKRRNRETGKRMVYASKLLTDGVLGLNRQPLSFPSQMKELSLAEHSIVLCLTAPKGYKAGYIAFGFPLRYLGKGHPWIELSPDRRVWQVPLQNIKYGGDSIIRGGDQRETEALYNIIVDGSKQFTYLDNELFQTLVNTVKVWALKNNFDFQQIEGEEGVCWSYYRAIVRDAELISKFHNLTLVFPANREGSGQFFYPLRMTIKPENYIISPAEGLVCLAVRSSDDINEPGMNILGGMAMKEHMILLDDMTGRFWWIEDQGCNIHRLKELKHAVYKR